MRALAADPETSNEEIVATIEQDEAFAANILREILDIRLRDVLRNDNGGTYDVFVAPLTRRCRA